MINIIGGKYRGTNLIVPEKNVRPTSALKREAIFSILESYALKDKYNLYQNKCFVDLYAGSGSLGLEAISRGATFIYFYETEKKVNLILLENCKKICKNDQFNIYEKDSHLLDTNNFNYDISVIFIDPPYNLNPFNNLLSLFIKKKILNKNTIIVIEADKNTLIKLNNEFNIIKEKTYGKSKIIFLKKN